LEYGSVSLLTVAPFLLILCAVVFVLIAFQLSNIFWADGCRESVRADQKATALLKAWLSSSQRVQYERDGHFEVTGSHSGKCYVILHGRQANIVELDEHGTRAASWCFAPEGDLATGDIMLAQKIALETNEPAALAIANKSR
jgi:hypothetical protein